MARHSVALVALLFAGACAAARYTPPTGPGEPAPDAATAWSAATSACESVQGLVFRVSLSGRVGERRIPRGGRFDGAATSDGRMLLEVSALGSQRLVLAGDSTAAVLWLRESGGRVVRARLEELLEALTGFRLAAADWLALLTGCVTTDRAMGGGAAFGARRRIDTASATIVLEPFEGRWRSRWARVGTLSVEYSKYDGAWPRELRLETDGVEGPPSNITVTVRERRVNPPAAEFDRAFAYQPPPGATPMTLEDLRAGAWRNVP